MTTVIQRSFAGGELAPSLHARVDLVKYQTGLKTCRNLIVQRHGGVTNRPGFKFVGEVKDSSKRVKLHKFVFNADQTYVLEFGNLYMRVIRNGAQVLETAVNITGITQANPAVVTANAHGYSNGDEVYIAGVVGMTQVNGRNFKVAGVTANTFQLQDLAGNNINSTAYTAYSSGGTVARVYGITTPYVEADLQELQIAQSGDTVTIVHPNYAPRELTRTGHAAWALATITFAPTQAAPTAPSATIGVAGSPNIVWRYQVTAVATETYEESLPTASFSCTGSTPTTAAPNTLAWTVAANAVEYNVYRETVPGSGTYGYIGTAGSNSFSDNNITPVSDETPPISRNPFNAASAYPSAVSYYQQRQVFANTDNDPEKCWTSRSANFKNFTIRSPLQDDDAVTFNVSGKQVNEIRHLVELGKLVVFTSGGEWTVEGDAAGTLKPANVNPKQHGYNGSSTLTPLIVGSTALYVQARGSIVRDLSYDVAVDGYRGNELTIMAAHLFDGYTLTDWDYQQIPHSVVWAVRSDGALLGLTYVREHQVWGWHHHDTGGDVVENVCVVPEGTEDFLYAVIKRTVNGYTKRYIERLNTRFVTDITVDAFFVDSGLSYDGRNTGATTMTLSGGTDWTYTENLTLTASASYFTAADVGNAIILEAADGTKVICTINAYTSGTVVTVKPNKTVPTTLRNVARTTWSKAVDELSNLWHLEGRTLSILADGNVEPQKTVSNGAITLTRPYAVIHAGLPITADFETLDIDSVQYPQTGKQRLVSQLTLVVESSRGIYAGPDANHLREYKQRAAENYGAAISLLTGPTNPINLETTWNSNGRIFVRQTDPLPLTILASVPSGFIGG